MKIPVEVALRGMCTTDVGYGGACESCEYQYVEHNCMSCKKSLIDDFELPSTLKYMVDTSNHRKGCSVPLIIQEWIKEDVLDLSNFEKRCSICNHVEASWQHKERKIKHDFIPWNLSDLYK